MHRLLIALSLIGCCAAADDPELQRCLAEVRTDLRERTLPFWAEHAIDRERGGYVTELGEDGSWGEPDRKYLLTQARLVWVFARAHNHGIDDRGYLELATHGARFLIDRMWDQQHGGFYWLVADDGTPLKDHKSVYTQTFAIYALSEYHLASGDPEALRYAAALFDLFVEHAASDGQPGFAERFNRDWSPRNPDKPVIKTLDTHMHLMECVTTLARASGEAHHREALATLVDLLVERAIDPEEGFAYARFDADFRPLDESGKRRRTSYGHNVELGWLLLDALAVLERDREPYRAAFTGLIDHALRYGADPERGGIAMWGPYTGAAWTSEQPGVDLRKSWWEQAELLVATCEAYAWTGEARYRDALLATWNWVSSHHIDREHGGWYAWFSWDGSERGYAGKGNGWKCAYHDGRALMELEQRLGALLAR